MSGQQNRKTYCVSESGFVVCQSMSRLDELKAAILALTADERAELSSWLVRLAETPCRPRVIRYAPDKKILAVAALIRQDHDALFRRVVV